MKRWGQETIITTTLCISSIMEICFESLIWFAGEVITIRLSHSKKTEYIEFRNFLSLVRPLYRLFLKTSAVTQTIWSYFFQMDPTVEREKRENKKIMFKTKKREEIGCFVNETQPSLSSLWFEGVLQVALDSLQKPITIEKIYKNSDMFVNLTIRQLVLYRRPKIIIIPSSQIIMLDKTSLNKKTRFYFIVLKHNPLWNWKTKYIQLFLYTRLSLNSKFKNLN